MSSTDSNEKTTNKKFVSLDPGINFCGMAVIDPTDEFKVIEVNLVKNARSFTAEEKILEASFGPRAVKVTAILNKLQSLIDQHDIKSIVIEAPFYNALTPMAYGSLLEVIFAIKYCIVLKQDLSFTLIEPTVVKRLFTNKGSAGKDIMRQFLITKKIDGDIKLPVEVETLSEHEVDAIAIGFVYQLSKQSEKT